MNRTAYGLGALIGTIAVVAILAVVALISQKAYKTWDLTANRRQSLSPESARALASLKQDVSLIAFYLEGQGGRREAEDLLRQYANSTNRIRYELVDPQKQVSRTEEYRIATNETVVVESGNRRESVTLPDEPKLTNAILKVTREGQRKVYFVTGHGERQAEDSAERGLATFRSTLEASGYTSGTLSLLTTARVPDDADVVVLAGPRTDLSKAEAERLKAYIDRGGHVLLLADLPDQPTPEIQGLVKPFGIDLREMVLIEPNVAVIPPDPLVAVIDQFAGHAITRGLVDRGLAGLMPIARPVIPVDQPPAGVQLDWLARSTTTSWATPVDLTKRGRVESRFDAKRDLKGPVTVAVAASVPAGQSGAAQPGASPAPGRSGAQAAASPAAATASPPAAGSPAAGASPAASPGATSARRARLVVVGDVDFASNQLFGQPSNRELAVGAVGWLASEDAIVSIAERAPTAAPLFLTPRQSLAAGLVAVGLPALATAAGIASWASRRRRHA
jgi:ABC-type uncharacterized transport system involved in gliding motility auxiliary subunit